MAPLSASWTAWYTGQLSQNGPRVVHSFRSASLSSRKHPLRVPTSNNVLGMSPHLHVEIPDCLSDSTEARESSVMATMADLDELALSLPQVTKDVSDDGRPSYLVHGKMFCFHRSRRPDAVDPETGERLADVLMFRVDGLDVKELMVADARGVYFTTPHFNGYPAVLMRIPDLERIDREELYELVVEAWLTRAQKRVAKAWLAEHGEAE